MLLSATDKRYCNNIAKKFVIVILSLIAFTAIEAKQVTITPLRGSAWFLPLEELGYLSIAGDSLFIIRNAGDTCAREALVDVQRIAVEEKTPTTLKTRPFPITGRKLLEPDGQIIILQDGKRYRVDGHTLLGL